MHGLFKAMAGANALIRRGKTVNSLNTAIRNVYGNVAFALMHGHVGLTPGFGQRKALIRAVTELGNGLGIVNRKGGGADARFDYLNRRRELGLLEQDVETR